MPVHVHGDEEEIFVVLEGSGVSFEKDAAYPIAAGDAILYPPSGRPHTVVAGPRGHGRARVRLGLGQRA